MKKMKKIMAFLLATCMVIGMMSTVSFAGAATPSSATGAYEDMHQLAVGGTIGFSIAAGESAYVQAADNAGTVVTVASTVGTWAAYYGARGGCTPDENFEGTFTMAAEGYAFFTIANTSETDSIYVYVGLAAGSAEENDGSSMDKALPLELMENWDGSIGAEWQEATIAEGADGIFYAVEAPIDGYISFELVDAYDDNGSIGWTYTLLNNTNSSSTDMHSSDDEVVSDKIAVSAGDKVIIQMNTYNPADIWNAPAGTIVFNVYAAAKGTEKGAETLGEGTHTVNALEGVDWWGDPSFEPYFVEYIAKEAGSLICTVSGENGWFYNYDYSMFYSDDEEVIDTWIVELKAGENVTLGLCGYDESSYTAEDVKVTFKFVPADDIKEVSVTEDEVKELEKSAVASGALFGKSFAISQISALDVLTLQGLEETTLKDLVYEAIDLTLWGIVTDEDGEESVGAVQPTAPIAITMALVEELKDAELIEIFRLDDGELVSLGEYEVEEGKISFSLEHFSTFVFADVTPEDEETPTDTELTPSEETPTTGDATEVLPFVVLAVAALAVLVVLKKKEVTE